MALTVRRLPAYNRVGRLFASKAGACVPSNYPLYLRKARGVELTQPTVCIVTATVSVGAQYVAKPPSRFEWRTISRPDYAGDSRAMLH